MSVRPEQVKAVFLEATEGHTPEEWLAFLDRACAGDADLQAAVAQLLRARADLGSFHESTQSSLGARVDSPEQVRPGTVIGPYKLLQQIGEGGMGTVYMAEQTYPVHRKVALKVIKPGMDSRQVIARFEAERQALALMDHVNIARVYDGGATESDRPYFVMELVHGVPITKYCDDNHLDAAAAPGAVRARSAMRYSTPTRRGSFTATSSHRTSWSRSTTKGRSPK